MERTFTRNLLRHPRRLWLRKAIFQVHLWVGLAAAVYLFAIALSGAVLVFEDELGRTQLPATFHPLQGTSATPQAVLQHLQATQPGALVSTLQLPSPVLPAFLIEGKDAHGTPTRWLADPVTAAIQPAPRTWVDVVHDLHTYLLLPHAWGMQANGIGALALLLLAISGIILWWPGTRIWTRGLRVNLHASWRRINYDLHSAIGFWTLAIVFWWAFSGVYFAWYRQVTTAISIISPVVGMASPAPATPPPVAATPSLALVLAAARQASPHGHLWSISNPQLTSPECFVLLDLAAPGDFSHRDIVRIRRDGTVLSIWHYGQRHTLADWLLWSMHPLHFGTLWGLPFKLLWATLGLTLAVLTVTGTILYWNRFLRHLWRKKAEADPMRSSSESDSPPQPQPSPAAGGAA